MRKQLSAQIDQKFKYVCLIYPFNYHSESEKMIEVIKTKGLIRSYLFLRILNFIEYNKAFNSMSHDSMLDTHGISNEIIKIISKLCAKSKAYVKLDLKKKEHSM